MFFLLNKSPLDSTILFGSIQCEINCLAIQVHHEIKGVGESVMNITITKKSYIDTLCFYELFNCIYIVKFNALLMRPSISRYFLAKVYDYSYVISEKEFLIYKYNR